MLARQDVQLLAGIGELGPSPRWISIVMAPVSHRPRIRIDLAELHEPALVGRDRRTDEYLDAMTALWTQPIRHGNAFHRDTSPLRHWQAACQTAAFDNLGTYLW